MARRRSYGLPRLGSPGLAVVGRCSCSRVHFAGLIRVTPRSCPQSHGAVAAVSGVSPLTFCFCRCRGSFVTRRVSVPSGGHMPQVSGGQGPLPPAASQPLRGLPCPFCGLQRPRRRGQAAAPRHARPRELLPVPWRPRALCVHMSGPSRPCCSVTEPRSGR